MLFNSYTFCLLFLPLCLAGFFVGLRWLGDRAVCGWLLAMSLGFYAWWNPAYLPLLLGSMAANYGLGVLIARFRSAAMPLLTAGVAGNLGLIGYYKYAGFFTQTASALTGSSFSLDAIALPLAISFFTFQQIAFLVDVKRNPDCLCGPLHYCLFVAFFPQLIAGPIVSHRDLVPQFRAGWGTRFPWDDAAAGLTLFAMGLFKKVMIADRLAKYAGFVYGGVAVGDPVSATDAWGGTLAYALQLYFDFSGYSDMAIGLGLMFAVKLPMNFDSPYQSRGIDDFWRRWHMTLGAFFREYLYFPLGGSRRGELRTAVNLFVVMLLCGLWHGAGWAFVAWGGLHGIACVVCRLWKTHGKPLPGPAAWALTFLFVLLAWVPFRAETLAGAGRVWAAMFGFGPDARTILDAGNWVTILAGLVPVLFMQNSVRWVNGEVPRWPWRPTLGYAYLTAAVLLVTVLNLSQMSTFLYFNF